MMKYHGVLLPGQTMIEDLTLAGDIPSNIAYINSFPRFQIWQDYLVIDPPVNEQIKFKYVYFKNGYPISGLNAEIPSGDLLFKRFHSEFRAVADLNPAIYSNPIISAEFGTTYTDVLPVEFNYDMTNKILTIEGKYETDNYKSYIGSYISSVSGITEIISLENKLEEYPIKLFWQRRN